MRHGADAAMSFIVIIWGLHFIVMKDGMEDIAPNSYNALRFLAGVPVMLAVAYTQRAAPVVARRRAGRRHLDHRADRLPDRFCLRAGPHHPPTRPRRHHPAWTALFSLFADRARPVALLAGIAITLVGVALVVLAGAEDGSRSPKMT